MYVCICVCVCVCVYIYIYIFFLSYNVWKHVPYPALISKQVCTVGWGTIAVIYKMFCNGRPVCVIYPVSKVVPLPYFHWYMLFNSWIQMLIGFPDVLQTANTSKRINQRTAMLVGENVFLTRSQNSPCMENHTQVGGKIACTLAEIWLVNLSLTSLSQVNLMYTGHLWTESGLILLKSEILSLPESHCYKVSQW